MLKAWLLRFFAPLSVYSLFMNEMASPCYREYSFYYRIWCSLPPYNLWESTVLISCSTIQLPLILLQVLPSISSPDPIFPAVKLWDIWASQHIMRRWKMKLGVPESVPAWPLRLSLWLHSALQAEEPLEGQQTLPPKLFSTCISGEAWQIRSPR